ncbi:hypothetical protein ACFU9W_24570, partial [Streptomyces sp. NPDC057600]|uniref:hypothetical protein n=1 Tax=Streptomyces sp. NPDC057600 TaxID=3346180 RepID=UPI0036C22E3B
FPVEAGSCIFAFQFFAFAFPFPAVPTLPDSFRSVSGSNLNSGDRWSGLCLSADSTLSETFGRKIGFVIQRKESMALRKFVFR